MYDVLLKSTADSAVGVGSLYHLFHLRKATTSRLKKSGEIRCLKLPAYEHKQVKMVSLTDALLLTAVVKKAIHLKLLKVIPIPDSPLSFFKNKLKNSIVN